MVLRLEETAMVDGTWGGRQMGQQGMITKDTWKSTFVDHMSNGMVIDGINGISQM